MENGGLSSVQEKSVRGVFSVVAGGFWVWRIGFWVYPLRCACVSGSDKIFDIATYFIETLSSLVG